METIKDVLFIKTIEKELGRRLSEEEINDEEGFETRNKDGAYVVICIPSLVYTHDLVHPSINVEEIQLKDLLGVKTLDPDTDANYDRSKMFDEVRKTYTDNLELYREEVI